jgi:hypothetical protein
VQAAVDHPGRLGAARHPDHRPAARDG